MELTNIWSLFVFSFLKETRPLLTSLFLTHSTSFIWLLSNLQFLFYCLEGWAVFLLFCHILFSARSIIFDTFDVWLQGCLGRKRNAPFPSAAALLHGKTITWLQLLFWTFMIIFFKSSTRFSFLWINIQKESSFNFSIHKKKSFVCN